MSAEYLLPSRLKSWLPASTPLSRPPSIGLLFDFNPCAFVCKKRLCWIVGRLRHRMVNQCVCDGYRRSRPRTFCHSRRQLPDFYLLPASHWPRFFISARLHFHFFKETIKYSVSAQFVSTTTTDGRRRSCQQILWCLGPTGGTCCRISTRFEWKERGVLQIPQVPSRAGILLAMKAIVAFIVHSIYNHMYFLL